MHREICNEIIVQMLFLIKHTFANIYNISMFYVRINMVKIHIIFLSTHCIRLEVVSLKAIELIMTIDNQQQSDTCLLDVYLKCLYLLFIFIRKHTTKYRSKYLLDMCKNV